MNEGLENIISTMKKDATFYYKPAHNISEKNLKYLKGISSGLYKYKKT